MFNNKIDDYDNELIRRYNYLAENSIYILTPYIYKESNEELKDRLELWAKDNFKHNLYGSMIYFGGISDIDLILIEKLLLQDIPLERTIYYKKLEKLKQNKKFLEKVKNGVKLSSEISLDINRILFEIETNILRQTGNLENKKLKLQILELYFSLNNNIRKENELYKYLSPRDRYDIGVSNNCFINYFINKAIYKKAKKWR